MPKDDAGSRDGRLRLTENLYERLLDVAIGDHRAGADKRSTTAVESTNVPSMSNKMALQFIFKGLSFIIAFERGRGSRTHGCWPFSATPGSDPPQMLSFAAYYQRLSAGISRAL